MIKNSPIGSLPGVCRIKTGSYTGDGSTGLSITGIGFKPIVLMIFTVPVSETTQNAILKIGFDSWGVYSLLISATTWNSYDNRILTLDNDGFTISDDSLNSFPNASGVAYSYICLG